MARHLLRRHLMPSVTAVLAAPSPGYSSKWEPLAPISRQSQSFGPLTRYLPVIAIGSPTRALLSRALAIPTFGSRRSTACMTDTASPMYMASTESTANMGSIAGAERITGTASMESIIDTANKTSTTSRTSALG
ncbi:hypothetical protein BC939DRAFT_444207 [Gamsiella multidivaricata]|uniref:uncharacterized protein n=1 Tax=Gamsiella multidivaricata TaxID=101098 RepID=UPI00221FDC66|nr:uncharacterized protein BC939DRAFT_444207 [Gamsiella multidivaricata]KAI7827979.1 hypothetical protein BC939DRAFT_444207 [Gamsiella multidivaricata]